MKQLKLLSILFLLTSLLTSCDELFNQDDDPTITDKYRIKKVERYGPEQTQLNREHVFSYENNKILQIITNYGSSNEDHFNNFTYTKNGDTIFQKIVVQSEIAGRRIFIVENDRLIVEEDQDVRDGKWVTEERKEYEYTGKKLTGITEKYVFDEEMKISSTTELIYQGDFVSNIKNYMPNTNGGNDLWYQDSIFSSDNKIDSIKTYWPNNPAYFVETFIYENDLLKKRNKIYIENNDTIANKTSSTEYVYNNQNRLETMIEKMTPTIQYATTFEWEEGTGNIGQTWVNPKEKALMLPTLK